MGLSINIELAGTDNTVMASAKTVLAHFQEPAARYSEVQVLEDYDKGWLCATGRRPRTVA